MAALSSSGSLKALRKSEPVPCGITPSTASEISARPLLKNPLTTSLTVPSPPMARMVRCPAWSAAAVRSMACRGDRVWKTRTSPKTFRNSAWIRGQIRPVRPFADLGFTIAATVPLIHEGCVIQRSK